MEPLIQNAATTLSVSPIDIYVLVAILVLWIVFLAMGIQRTYEAYFGLVVGLAIYLMLTVLLSPAYQTAETVKIISPGAAKFLIGSSAYLIFILFILTPILWGVPISETKTKSLRYLELAAVSAFVLAFFFALILGFIGKTYIFNVDTAFGGIAKIGLYQEVLAGKIFSKFSMYLQPIVLFGVLFLMYKMLLSDLVMVIFGSIGKWLISLKKKGKKDDGADAAGGHDEHGGGHDEHGGDDHGGGHDEHGGDDHGGGHDEHGGGGHH